MAEQVGQIYNDNAVQYGSILATIKRGQPGATVTLQAMVLDNVTINRPVKEVEKSNQIGGPNGWAAVNAQCEGNCMVQMGPVTDKWPKNGDWFENTFDTDIGVERYVLLNVGMPFEVNGYFKVNAKLKRAHFPAV